MDIHEMYENGWNACVDGNPWYSGPSFGENYTYASMWMNGWYAAKRWMES